MNGAKPKTGQNTKTKAIAKRKPSTPAKPKVEMSETGALVQMAIDKDLDLDKLERVIAMHKGMKADQAKDSFNRSFAEMKAELPIITKGMEAKNDDGSVMYMFAPLEDLQEACDPILSKYGFSYHWEEEFIESTNSKRVLFILEHKEGHQRSNYFDVPEIQGTKRNNAIQVQGIKSSYGKRYTMQSGTGIIIKGEDRDANFLTFNVAVEYADQIVWLKSCQTLDDLKDVWTKVYKDLKTNNDQIGKGVLTEVYNNQKKAVTNGTV